MDFNFSVFQEPRGVMRILHFIFSICAFATISGYTGHLEFSCANTKSYTFFYEYPFTLLISGVALNSTDASGKPCDVTPLVSGNFSSDAKFFVATGVLAMLYAIAIIVVYTKFDELYRTNSTVPLCDFALTVLFGVLWLSSSAAWANGLTGLKHITDGNNIDWEPATCNKCSVYTSGFSTLNISVIFGFLNFFLWAADLWFLYKETAWFQNAQAAATTTDGV